MKRISNYISAKKNSAQLNSIVKWRKDVEDTYALYLKEHALIEDGCPASFVTNPYFDADFHNAFHEHYYSIMFELSNLEQQWHTQHQASQIPNIGETQPFQSSKLPEIKMPTFSGTYSEWPAFKELFTGMILNRTGLTDVAKLHYLRSSLKGSPLTWIEGFTLSGESLLPSWNTLVDRFENKRSLVNDHLDHLNDLSAAQPKNPASLNTLISQMSKIRISLHLLVPKDDLGDCILAQKMSKLLDRPTREAWETSRVSTKEFPKYEDFEVFLVSRVRVLEIASDAPPSPPKQSAAHSKPLKAYHTTSPTTGQSSQQDSRKVTHSPRITQHPCTYCGEPHYIVACPEFKRLNEQERRKFVTIVWVCIRPRIANKNTNVKRATATITP